MKLLTILFTLLTFNLFAQTNRIEYAQPDGILHYVDVPVVTSILPSLALVGVKDTLLYNGAGAIDFVIMGDGFTSSEQDSFVFYAQKFVNKFLLTPPYSAHPYAYNFYILKINSSVSGIKHPNTASDCNWANPLVPVSTVTSPFNLSFDYSGTHRLVYVNTTSIIGETMYAAFPNADYGLVIANSIYYGGAGGTYPVATKHSQSSDIMIHELGHTFASLADEYGGGTWCGPERANITNITSPLKWDSLINTYFLGANYCNTWYRPQLHCMMENLSYPYCIVCSKVIDNKIKQLVPQAVVYPPLLVTNQVGAEICPSSGWILQTTSGGNPPYSYLWNNGNTEPSLSFLTSGTYYCTVNSADNQVVSSTYYVGTQNIGTATGLGFTAIGNTKIKVTCYAVPYANKYQFYYRKSGTTAWQTRQVTTPSVTISNLIPNTLYQFKVRGRCYDSNTNVYKNGAFSNISSYATAMRIEYEFSENNQPFIIYNLLGEVVYTGTKVPYNLIPGAYIITKGNTIKKIVVVD